MLVRLALGTCYGDEQRQSALSSDAACHSWVSMLAEQLQVPYN